MEIPEKIKKAINLLSAVVLLLVVVQPTYSQTVKTNETVSPAAKAPAVKSEKAASSKAHPKAAKAKKKAVPPLDIQGFRIGMTAAEVKQLLAKKNIRGHETGFSDVLVYSPSPGTDVRLLLTCTDKGNVLSRVELTTSFTAEETAFAVPKFREQLAARYGAPLFPGPQGDVIEFCWGQCEQGAAGVKLTAVAAATQGNERTLALTLSNDSLIKACSELRPKKINNWLYQWIDTVQMFKIGMSLKDAEKLYQARYQNELELDEERDEAAQHYVITNYVAKDFDFFTALDYESQAFEGLELGVIVLKFTGDQAGKDGMLNKKLYYASFSTTKFNDQHAFPDVKEKLEKFIKAYGTPLEVVPKTDGITARWRQNSLQRSVSIFDSGLITFEQSSQSLKDAYREAAIQEIEEYTKTRFDSPIF